MDKHVQQQPEPSGEQPVCEGSVVQLGELADEALRGVRHRRHQFPGRSRPAGKTRDASGSIAGKAMGDQTDSAGRADRAEAIRDPDERARVWSEAVAAAADGEAELRSAAQDAGPGGPAGARRRTPAPTRRPGTRTGTGMGMGLTSWLGQRPT